MGRRSRYQLAAFLALALGSPTPTLALANDMPSFSVKCWRMETSSSSNVPIIASAATDDACPVSVSIADLTASFAPNDDVPAMWSVTLKSAADTTNALAMPLPPPATSANGPSQPSTQITATYVRSCSSIAACDPTSAAASTSAIQTGNFTAAGDALSFSVIRGVKFASEGAFPIGAFVTVRDAVSPGVTYVFAAYASVTIKAKATAVAHHREGVVRCRMSRQSALNATLDASASVSESSNCEVRMALAPLAVVRPNDSLAVSWIATLAPRDDADIHLPSPLTPVAVGDSGQTYEIIASYVKLCKDNVTASCDEYTPVDGLAAQVSAGPASFSPNGNVTFKSPPITVATAGRHAAMLHLVVAGPGRRYDFLYDFELLATLQEVPAQAPVKTDGSTSYCWDVLADATRDDATEASVTATASGSNCPYLSTLPLAAPSTPLQAGSSFNLTVSLSTNANYSALTSPLASQVNLSSVYDPVSKTTVSLPTLRVFACSAGTACSPFSPNKTLLQSLPARNLEDGTARVSIDGLSLPSEGNYTILVHSVFPNGASRIDTAVYSAVRVVKAAAASPAKGKKSHTVLYVLVSVGSVVAVVLVVLVGVWLRRRLQRQRMEKMVQFGLFPATRPGTVNPTPETRGSFQSGDSGRGSFSFLRVQASQPSPMDLDTPRDGSLSYDPYQRASFQDMSMNESNLSFAFTDNERPSGLVYDDGPHKAYNV